MTIESTIPDLLFKHLDILSGTMKIAYPNVPFEPPDDAYLEARYLPNTNRNFLIGVDDPTQHLGLLQVTVVGQSNIGEIEVLKRAGQVVEHFKKGTRLQEDDVIVDIYSKPSIAPAMQDGNRYRVPVTIQYQCMHT